MERRDAAGWIHNVDGLENGSPEDWCVVDEWSEHSESELEEGEIVDSDSTQYTKKAVSLDNVLAFVADTRRTASLSDVHSGDTRRTVGDSDVFTIEADGTIRTVSHNDRGTIIRYGYDTRRTVSHSDVHTVTGDDARTLSHSDVHTVTGDDARTVSHIDVHTVTGDTEETVVHSGKKRTVGHKGKKRTAGHKGKRRSVSHSGKKRTVHRHRKVRKEIYDTATGIWLKMADFCRSEDGEIVDPENALNHYRVGEANADGNSTGNVDVNSFPSGAVGVSASSDFHVGSRQKPVPSGSLGVKASSDFHVGSRQKPVPSGALAVKASSDFHVGIRQKPVPSGALGVKASSDFHVGSRQKPVPDDALGVKASSDIHVGSKQKQSSVRFDPGNKNRLLRINRQKAASYQSGKLLTRPGLSVGGRNKQHGGGTEKPTKLSAEEISTPVLQENEVIDSAVQNTVSTEFATAHDEDLATPCSSPNIDQETDQCNSSFDALDAEFATSMREVADEKLTPNNDNVTVERNDGSFGRNVETVVGSTECVLQQSVDPDEVRVPADLTYSDLSAASSADETTANVMTSANASRTVPSAPESSINVVTPTVTLATATSKMSLSVTADECKVSMEGGLFGNVAAAFGAESEMESMTTDLQNGENEVMESLGSYGATSSSEANADFTDYLAADRGIVRNDTGVVAENTSLTNMDDELITAIAELVREDEELAAKNKESEDLEEGFLYEEPAFETTPDSEANGDAEVVDQDEVLAAEANETVKSPAVFLNKEQDIETNPDIDPNRDVHIDIPATVSSGAFEELVDDDKVLAAEDNEQPMETNADDDLNSDTDFVIPATVSSDADLVDQNEVLAAEAKETVVSEEVPEQTFETNELNIHVAPPATVSSAASVDLVDRDELLPADADKTASPRAVFPDKDRVIETDSDNEQNIVDRAAIVSMAEALLSAVSVSTSDSDTASVMPSIYSSPGNVDVTSSSVTAEVTASSEIEVPSADMPKDTVQHSGNDSGELDPGKEPCRATRDAGEAVGEDVDAVASIQPDTGCNVQGTMKLGGTNKTAAITIEQDDGTIIDVDSDNHLIAPLEDQSHATDSKTKQALLRNNAVAAMLFQIKGRPVSAGPELMRRLTDSDSETAGFAQKVSQEHPCDFCNATFNDESQLILHINTHEVIQPALKIASTFVYSHKLYQCVACHFSTRSRQVFREHTRSHIVKYPYWCGLCRTAINSYDSLLRHSGSAHPCATLKLVPRCSLTLEQILHKIGPAAPSTMTKLQKADGTPMCCVMRSTGSQPDVESSHAVSADQHVEDKDQHPVAEQVIMVDDVEGVDNQNGDSTDSLCHLKIASVVSLSHSASAIENFSKKDDNIKENSVVMPEMYDSPAKLHKSNVFIECFFKDGLYQCRRCRFKTPDQRVFRCHVVQEVHEKSDICHDCRNVPMPTLLSETHSCPVVKKVMLAMRKQLQESGGGRPESTTSAAGPSCPDKALVARSAPVVPEEGYTLHITEADDTTMSGLKFQTTVSTHDSCSTQASPVAIPPVPKTVYFVKPHHGSSIASGSVVPSSTAVRVTPSSPHGSHHVIRVNRPTGTPITPTPIVIQPISPGHLDRITTTSSDPLSLVTVPIYGTADSATHLQSGATTGQWKTPATKSVETQMTTIRTSSGCSENMEDGYGGSWPNQLPVGPFCGASPAVASCDARPSMDSPFTEAFSMLQELGNAQAGLSAPPHPQLTGSTSDVNIRSMLASPSTETLPPLLDVTGHASGSNSDTAPRLIDVVPPQPRRTGVVSSIARSSSSSPNMQQVASLPERPDDSEKDDRFSFYRCGFPACNFLGESETSFCNHYFSCHKNVYVYRCAFCAMMFRYPPGLCEHMRTFHHDARYRCLSCHVPFQTQRQLIIHMIQAHRHNASIRCASPSGCVESSNSLSQFRHHYALHHSTDSRFTCSCCSMEFVALAPLLRHIEKSFNRFVSCPVCRRMSTASACKKLLQHILSEHPKAPRTIVKMNFINCWEKLSIGNGTPASASTHLFMPDILNDHSYNMSVKESMSIHSGKGDNTKVKASKPPKQTARKAQGVVTNSVLRKELMRVEAPEKMLKCERCNFACTIQVLLEQHRRLHDRVLDIPPDTLYKCPKCPFFSKAIAEFRTHSSYHLGPQTMLRYFRCTRCRHATNDMNLIEDHMEKKHPNVSCSYKVVREELTHPNAPLSCPHCSATCLGEASLSKHVSLRHCGSSKPSKVQRPSDGCLTPGMVATPAVESPLPPSVTIDKYHCDSCEFDTNSMELLRQHHSTVHVGKTTIAPPAVVVKTEPESEEIDVGTESIVELDMSSPRGTLLTCAYCPYDTRVPDHMKRHTQRHEQQKKITDGFGCCYCSYVTPARFTITRHMRRYHPYEPMKIKSISGGETSLILPVETTGQTDNKQGSGAQTKDAVVVGTVKEVQNGSAGNETGSPAMSIGDVVYQSAAPNTMYTCSICLFTSKNRSHFARHKRNHSDTFDKGYRCTYCGYTSTKKSPVAKHIASQHPGMPVRISHFHRKPSNNSLPMSVSNVAENHLPEMESSVVQQTATLSKPSQAGVDDKSSAMLTGESNQYVTPEGIAAFERTLPKEMIFKVSVECPMCDYSTKVHYNMVRHLQAHSVPLEKPEEVQEAKVEDAAGHMAGDTASNDDTDHKPSSEMIGTEEENDKPVDAEKQPTETGSSDDSSSEEDNSDYVVNEGDETSVVTAKASDDYCVRVHNMDLYRCTKCVFMHRFPSKVRRHYFYKHAKCYPYKCGHCTFEAVESGKIKRHCVLMHDLLPIKVIKRQIENDPSSTPSEGVVMTDARHDDVNIIDDDGTTVADDTDGWIEAFIAKTHNDNHQQCRICGYVQMGASSVKQHVLAVHLKFYPYGCRYCSYAQVELNKVKKHIEHSHPGRPCTVVKRKLGVPPAECGDDDVQSDGVTEKDDREPSTGKDLGDGIPGESIKDNESGEASIDVVMKQLLDSISDAPTTDASKGGQASTANDKEDVGDGVSSDASDVARQCPDGIAEETSDDIRQTDEVPTTSIGDGNESTESDVRGDNSDRANDQTTSSVAGHASFPSNDEQNIESVRDANDQISTGPAGGVQTDPIGISNTKNNITSGTSDHDFEPSGDNSTCPPELSVDSLASAMTESTSEHGMADATDSPIGTRDDGGGGSVGSLMTSSSHRGDDQTTESVTDEIAEALEPSSSSEGHTSSEAERQSSDGKCDDQMKEGKDKTGGQDKREVGRLVLKLSIPPQHRRDVGSASDGEEDGASGNDDSDGECVDFEADGDDTDKTDAEDTSHIPCSDSSLAPQDGQSQARTVDHMLRDMLTGAGATSKSSSALMTIIKQEPSSSLDGQSRHREEPILSMFANELAETAMKGEHSTPHHASDPDEQLWPMTIKHSPSSPKQRRAFLCVYCEYRSMYSPSDVRKHIFAVHMRRYPYRCSYCSFQNMKKFSVEKHTKKTHPGRPISVSEAPVFRDNITILESQGNRVNVGVVDDKGIPVLDADLLAPLLHKLDPSPTKDIPGKKWTRRSPVPPPPLQFDLRSETKKESAVTDAPVSQWRCTECGMQAEEVDRVHVHVLTRHLKLRPYQCAYCEWGTWKTTPVEEHIRLKHPAETLKVLNNGCEKLSEIQKYVEEIPATKPAIAPPISKMILEIPVVDFGGQLPTMHCDLCPYTASSQSRLQKHRKTHFCYRPFGCFHCDYTSFSQFKVRCHSSRVHKDKQVIVTKLKTPDMMDPRNNEPPSTSPYKSVGAGVQVCSHCPYTGSTSEKLDSHMKREHPEMTSYKCGHCGIYLTSKEHMAAHVVEVHATVSRSGAEDNVVGEGTEMDVSTDVVQRHPGVVVKSEHYNETTTTSIKRPLGDVTLAPPKKFKLSQLLSTPKPAEPESKASGSPTNAGYLFRCKHCNFTSTLSLVMRHHTMAHLHYRPFLCPLCENVRAVKSYPIKKHIAAYHQGANVLCEVQRDSEMETKVQESYTRETLWGTVLARCEKIGTPPSDSKTMPVDSKTPLVDGKTPPVAGETAFVFVCDLCPYTSSTHKFMQHHVMAHLNYRPYRCLYCTKMRSVRNYPVKSHIMSMHRGRKIDVVFNRDAGMEAKVAASFHKQPLVSSQADSNSGSALAIASVSTVAENSDKKDIVSDKRPKTYVHTNYICKWCGYVGATPSLVRLHSMIHFGYRPFCCPYCSTMKSVRSYPIKKHIRAMHPGKAMEVLLKTDPDIEAKVAQSYTQQVVPTKGVVGVNSTKDCAKKEVKQEKDEIFAVVQKGGVTRKKSKDEECFECNSCPYTSPKWTLMRRHVMAHFGYRPYHCAYCDKMKSVRGSPVRLHIQAMHAGKSTNVVYRPDVAMDEKVLAGFSRPAKHVEKSGPPDRQPRPVVEPLPPVVESGGGVTDASATVSPKRAFTTILKCCNCSFTTKYKADLRFHQMGEMDYRPFHCAYCDHRSVGRCLLRKHQRNRHSGKFSLTVHRQPECEVKLIELMEKSVDESTENQPSQTDRGADLRITVKLERGASTDGDIPDHAHHRPCYQLPRKRYACHECQYSCTKRKLLVAHKAAHHGPKKYSCSLCGYEEYYPSMIRRHCQRNHKGMHVDCINIATGDRFPLKFTSSGLEVPTTPSAAATSVKTVKPVQTPSNLKPPTAEGTPPENVTQLFNKSIGKYECFLCPYSNRNMTLFKKHVTVHFPARWQCGHCSLKFRQMDRLRRHSRQAHPCLPIKCVDDAKDAITSENPPRTTTRDASPQGSVSSTSSAPKFTARKSAHTIVPVVDEPSPSETKTPSSAPRKKLTARKSIHRFVPALDESLLRFLCGLCAFAATNEDALSKHMMVVHSSGNAVLLKCGFCSFSAYDDAAFIEHARSHAIGNVIAEKPREPEIDPNGADMQPDVALTDLLHLSQSELEKLLIENDIGGIYF